MGNRQDQSVSDNGTAIQASGDVHINQGMSPAQMADVMGQLLDVTNRFTAEAMSKVDARVAEFQESILKQFAEGQKGNSEAFRDPDFQYMLGQAQEAYARSGDDAVKETLADIIARRSVAESASREALTLNDAATRAPRLTKAEFAALSLCYILKYTRSGNMTNGGLMAKQINDVLLPLAREVSREQSSIWHIEAQSCGTVSFGEASISDIWRDTYPGLLGMGVPREQYVAMFPPEQAIMLDHVLIPCIRNPAYVQPRALTVDVFLKNYIGYGFTSDDLTQIWNAFVVTIPGDIRDVLRPLSPDVDFLFETWSETQISSLNLNSVGIAIGHANAVRAVGFDAPLSVWIK